MADTVKIKVGIEDVRASEDIVEIDRAEWEAKTEKEQEAYLLGLAQDEIDNSVNAYAFVVEED